MALDKNVPLVTNTIAADLIAINANWEAIVSDIAYDVTTWDAVIDIAPSKNAVRDKIATMDAAIAANTAKNTNVPTALSVGTVNTNTVSITSDGSADDVTLPAATVSTAGMLTTAKWAEIVANTAKVTNATHTGDVTGATALTIAAATVGQAQLKTSQQTVTLTGTNTVITALTGGEYCFKITESATVNAGGSAYQKGVFPGYAALTEDAASAKYFWRPTDATLITEASYVTLYSMTTSHYTNAKIRYITASGELHWIFILYNKAGNIICTHEAPDHPTMGNRGIEHPFASYDPTKHNIVVINPSMEQVEMIQANCLPAENGGWMSKEKSLLGIQEDYLKPTRPFMESFLDLYEIQESQKADWPDTPVTIALPKMHNGRIIHDWRFMPQFDSDGKPVKISPIKRVIPKPDYITCLKMRKKA